MVDKEGRKDLVFVGSPLPWQGCFFHQLGRVMGQIEHAIGCYIVFGYLYVGRENYIYP